MKFTPKKSLLKETEANPLDIAMQDSSVDDQYKQAILKAIASEVNAEVEYEQILQLEDKVSKDLVKLFHDTLVDIKEEEIKHIAQLTTKSSQRSDMASEFQKGVDEADEGEDEDKKKKVKESFYSRKATLTEAVDKNRKYNPEEIEMILIKSFGIEPADERLDNLFRLLHYDLEAEEVDKLLASVKRIFNLNDEQMNMLENKVILTKDPEYAKNLDIKDTVKADIETIQDTIGKLYTEVAKNKLFDLIEYLEAYIERID